MSCLSNRLAVPQHLQHHQRQPRIETELNAADAYVTFNIVGSFTTRMDAFRLCHEECVLD